LLESLPLERDDRGRVLVDESLRVRGRPELWAGGDCASVPHPRGGTCSPVALYSIAHGRHIGANIARSVRGRPLEPYRRDVKMQGVSIGRRTAVGELGGIGLHGLLPWLFWRAVLTRVVPSWDRRVRLVADWAIWPFVGRDITQLGSALRDDYEVEHYSFETGETMFERRRPTRYVHVIVAGSAELVSGPEAGRKLVPGDHFGAAFVDGCGADSVRAVSPVRTVALRADQAERLRRILESAGSLGSG